MERRDFLKISVLTGAATALDGCGSPDTQLIRFLPEEDMIPGVATWKPSVCTLCPAGCGLHLRPAKKDDSHPVRPEGQRPEWEALPGAEGSL